MDKRYHLSPLDERRVYESHNNTIDDPGYVAYFKRFIEAAIIRYTKSDSKDGLDFGSGPEPVLAMVLEKDYGWTMDIYDKFFAPEPVCSGKTYSLITSTEVIEHLDHPLQYFRLFKQKLRPGGILSVMTHFHPECEAAFLDWHYIRDPSHIAFYTPKTMKLIAGKTGFQILYSDNNRYTTFAHAPS